MKKMLTAILLFDLIAGLLFLGMQEMRRYRSVEAGSSRAAIIGEDRVEDIKKIAITFDDGPHPSYTEQLLDGLKERGVHATFFVTGDCVMILADWQNPVNKRVFVDLVLRKNAGCGVIFA